MKLVSVARRLLSVLALCATGLTMAADLTVTAFGGAWEQAYRKCFVQPFEKSTGKSVDVVLGSPTQWMNQIAANPTKPAFDVIINAVDGGKVARERGLVEKMTVENVPNLAQIRPRLLQYGAGYGFPLGYGNFGLMYNTDTVKTPPKTWKEFTDGVVAGKWKAAVPGIAYVATPAGFIGLFATVYGGKFDNVQPAFDQIKRLRDSGNVTFYSDPNGPLTAMRSGDIDMAMYFDGRAWAEHDAGTRQIGFVNLAPGTVPFPSMAQKVKNGSPLAWQFLNVIASTEGQSCFGEAIQYPMSNRNVEYSATLKSRIAPEDRTLWPPFDEISTLTPAWIEMWNKQIGR
jgi:putative spermidine/putrescine transport system substrate-binding protein